MCKQKHVSAVCYFPFQLTMWKREKKYGHAKKRRPALFEAALPWEVSDVYPKAWHLSGMHDWLFLQHHAASPSAGETDSRSNFD